jgi:transketolase
MTTTVDPPRLRPDTRQQVVATTEALLDEDPRVAFLIAEISRQFLTPGALRRHPDRIVNVGIREQLLVSAAGGMALAGMRPVAHTFGSFLVERAFEQVKLDLVHQGAGAVLVGSGGSFDAASAGRTHQSPGDLALLDTLPEVTLHAPSTVAEVDRVLREAVAGTGVHYVRVEHHTNR